MESKDVLIIIVLGAIAGWLASFVVGGSGFLRYTVSGVVGSFVGSFVLSSLGINLRIANGTLRYIVTSTIGAILVVVVARLLA